MSDDDKHSRGGRVRATKLTPAQRSEIAKSAAEGRWSVHYALDEGVVDLVGMKFRCAVLDGEIRVISGTEFMRVMGIYRSEELFSLKSSRTPVGFIEINILNGQIATSRTTGRATAWKDVPTPSI